MCCASRQRPAGRRRCYPPGARRLQSLLHHLRRSSWTSGRCRRAGFWRVSQAS